MSVRFGSYIPDMAVERRCWSRYYAYEAGINLKLAGIVPDKTEIHVESIPVNVFSRELLRPIDTGFVVLKPFV
jgi:hypothetical protein